MANANPLLPSITKAPGLLLLHVPPVVPVVMNRLAVPAHIADEPIIVPGFAPALITILKGAATENPQLLET